MGIMLATVSEKLEVCVWHGVFVRGFYSYCFRFIDDWLLPFQCHCCHLSHAGWPWGTGDPPVCCLCQHGVLLFPRSGASNAEAFTGYRSGSRHGAAQLSILCWVQGLLITLLLTSYRIGQCLPDRASVFLALTCHCGTNHT